MLYSPVRYSVYHSVLPLHGTVVQLACVTHAASVHPEPGSNSQLIDLLGLLAKLTIPPENKSRRASLDTSSSLYGSPVNLSMCCAQNTH